MPPTSLPPQFTSLSPDDLALVHEWLQNHTYDEVRQKLLDQFGIAIPRSSLARYNQKLELAQDLADHTDLAVEVQDLLDLFSAKPVRYDQAAIALIQKRAFELARDPSQTPARLHSLLRIANYPTQLDLNQRRLALAEKRYALAEKRQNQNDPDAAYRDWTCPRNEMGEPILDGPSTPPDQNLAHLSFKEAVRAILLKPAPAGSNATDELREPAPSTPSPFAPASAEKTLSSSEPVPDSSNSPKTTRRFDPTLETGNSKPETPRLSPVILHAHTPFPPVPPPPLPTDPNAPFEILHLQLVAPDPGPTHIARNLALPLPHRVNFYNYARLLESKTKPGYASDPPYLSKFKWCPCGRDFPCPDHGAFWSSLAELCPYSSEYYRLLDEHDLPWTLNAATLSQQLRQTLCRLRKK